MSSIKQPKRHPRTILNHISFRMLYGRIVKEQQYLTSLYYNLKVIGWDDITLFPDGFLVKCNNVSFLYERYPLEAQQSCRLHFCGLYKNRVVPMIYRYEG